MPADAINGDGAGQARRDGRLNDAVHALHSHDVLNKSLRQLVADPHRGAGQEQDGHQARPDRRTGVVVYSVPYCNWYRVQLDGLGGTIACTAGGESAYVPVGPRATGVIPPYSQVVVEILPGRTHGIIVAAYPLTQHDGTLACPDWISQGGQSGLLREDAYKQPFQLYREGGIDLFGSNRPVDSTTMEWGRITETGTGVHLDAYMAYIRASEICGLFVHYWDDYMRLAGWNMDWQTAAHEVSVRSDEGELRYVERHSVYPHETLGLYKDGEKFTTEHSDKDVQFNKPVGKIDFPDDARDVQSVARYEEYGGYLGQGRKRVVSIPAKEEGKRRYRDDPTTAPDMGVFEENISLDGTYSLRYARAYYNVRYPVIPVAKEMRRPEDQQTGDDARQDNYKFSGKHGGGAPHKVGDVAVSGTHQHLTTAAGVMDLIAYAFNWQGLHPFHYHKEDYKVPQEKDIAKKPGAPDKAQDFLDFGQLAGQMYMDYPTPRSVKVDDRYGEVKYFARVAYHCMLPDGSQVLGDGCGAEIAMIGGRIRLSAPGGIDITPGTDFNVFAGRDINLRAKESFDASAGNKDLRLKGQGNVQVVSNAGGVLVESKADTFLAEFRDKIGEDVVSGGIVFKAKNSAVVAYGGDVYLRTGGDSLRAGQIVLDASKGRDQVVLKGTTVNSYAKSGVGHFIGPDGANSTVSAAYLFEVSGCVIDKQVTIGGQMCVLGSMLVDGGILNRDGYSAVNNTPLVQEANGGALSAAAGECRKAIEAARLTGRQAHKALFKDWLYQSKMPGHDSTIDAIGFSFRDEGAGEQYHATQFKFAESRWQQMARLGGGSGGSEWDEPKVMYQGREQLPYPGKTKWEDEATLLRLDELTMFDAAKGYAKDRAGPYEDPKLGTVTPVPPKTGFKVIG